MKQISALLRYVLLTIGVCVSSVCWAKDDEVAFDWRGTYVVVGEVAPMTDAMDYQATSFEMEIQHNEAASLYVITCFLDTDVSAINYGGIIFTPSGNTGNIDISQYSYVKVVEPGSIYLKLGDAEFRTGRTADKLFVEVNEDGSLSISDFSVCSYNYASGESTPSAHYRNIIAVKKVEDVPDDDEELPKDEENKPIIETITSRPATLDDYQNVLLMSSLGEWESGYQQVNNYGSCLYYESPVLDGFPSTSNPVLIFPDYGLIIYTSDDGKVYNHQTDELMRADGIVKVSIPTTTKRIKICFKDIKSNSYETHHLVRIVDIPSDATTQTVSDLNLTLNYGTLEDNSIGYEKFPLMTLEEFMKELFGFSNAEEYKQIEGSDSGWEDIYETAKEMYEMECESGSIASLYVRDFTFTHPSLSQLPSAYIKFADYAKCSDTVFFKINGEYIGAVPVIGNDYYRKYTSDMLIPYGTEEIRFRSTFKADGYVDMMDRDLPYPLCSIVNVGSEDDDEEDLPADGEAEQQPVIESITSRPATLDDYQNVLLMSSLGEWESGYQQVNNYGSYLYYESPVLDGFPSTSTPVLMFADYGLIIYTSDDGKVYNHQTDELMRTDGIIKVGIPTTTKRIKICFKDNRIDSGPEAHLVRVVDIPSDATTQTLSDLNLTLNYGTLEDNSIGYEKFPLMTLEKFMKEVFGYSNAEEYKQMNGGDDVIWEDIYETAKEMYEMECESGSIASLYARDFTFTHPSLSQLPSAYIKFADYAKCSDTVFFKINGEYVSASPAIGGQRIPGYYTSDMLIPYGTEEIRFRSTFKADGYVDMMGKDLPYPLCSIVNVGSEKSPIGNWVQLDAPTDRELWYDLDGDGTMEYKKGNNVYMLNPSASQAGLLGSSYGKWVNSDNDEYIDAYENGYIYIGDNSLLHKRENAYIPRNEKVLNPIDYNNDGRPDFIIQDGAKGKTLVMDAAGNWQPSEVDIISPEEYVGLDEKLNLVFESGWQLEVEDMFIGSSQPFGTLGGFTSIDLDGDGDSDFIDYENGYYYIYVEDGRLVEYQFGGQMMPRDFNGDGIVDFLMYDADNLRLSVMLSQEDGSRKETKLITGLYCSNKIWSYDFDKDGDVDILVPFDYSVPIDGRWKENGGSFLVMMENKGDDTFKRHENFVDGEVYFQECKDIDADGCYEVIGYIDGLYAYEIDGMEVSADAELLWTDGKQDCLIVDINSDGQMEVLSYGKMYTLNTSEINSAPDAPAVPGCTYNAAEGSLTIMWDAATDQESATLDLTYALRIGTGKDKGDMVFAHAQADGTRRNLLDGNNGYSRYRKLNVSGWPAGKYYISVQTIDPNGRGSAFSEYAIFEKKDAPAGFLLSYNKYYSVGDTCKVMLLSAKDPSLDYCWDWGGATLLGHNDDETIYYITFTEGGEKLIGLDVCDATGELLATTESPISVNPGNIARIDDGYEFIMAFDLDEDGLMEVLNVRDKIYEGDSNGNYSIVKYIYNTNMSSYINSYSLYHTDANRDGRVDIYNPEDGYMIVNEENKQMAVTERIKLYDGGSFDIDNDGDLDYWKGKTLYLNAGDYSTFTEMQIGHFYDSKGKFVDYNRDGLIDFISSSTYVYVNNGENTFYPLGNHIELGNLDMIADLDGDGTLDYIYCHSSGHSSVVSSVHVYSKKLSILYGDGTQDSIMCEKGNPFIHCIAVYDVDNNGCLDMICSCHESHPSEHCVIYFQKNGTYSLNWIDGAGVSIPYYRTNGDLALGDMRISDRKNEKPLAPTQLRASQNDRMVVVEWNHSIDKETPANLMRYNISIKYKGKTGENAYFYSPMNSTKNGVFVPTHARLLTGNYFTIPITSIAPGEYEVQVQGIDRWEEPSDFSEVFNLTVKESSLIDMPASGMVDDYITIKILGNTEQMVSFGEDATIIREDKNSGYYTVSYSTPGTKTVAVGSLDSQDIYIYPRPEGAFTLPERIMKGAKVTVAAPNATMGAWNVRWEGNTYAINNDVCSSMEIVDENQIVIHFKQYGNYTVEHQIGGSYYMASTIADHRVSSPVITIVNTDEATGKHKVNWNTAVDDWMDVRSINVYKETSRYDIYELIASVPVEQGTYVDMNSMPEVKASRYRLSYVTGYGESESSVAHQSIHVMINRGIGNTWNLQWSKYEGVDVVSYRILGGVTPESLELIAEVSGNVSSYSDLQRDGKSLYYAVEIVQDEITLTRNAAMLTSRSNVVSIDEAFAVNFAEKIILKVQDDLTELSIGNHSAIQLAAILYPANTTIQKVNWMIWEGHELATIDANGRLMLTGTAVGKLTVRACAVDGSDVYSEVNFNVVKAVDDAIDSISQDSAQQTIVIYDLMGRKVIDMDKIKNGVYIINGKKVVIK